MNKLKKQNQGFTIIEVVLVLAIAGLIFLIVFLALPRLQRSRRDTQRRNDGANLIAQIESYGAAHNGSYDKLKDTLELNGTAAGKFKYDYLSKNANDKSFVDPTSDTPYNLAYVTDDSVPAATGTFNVVIGKNTPDTKKCDGSTNTTARDIVVRARLESGTYCNSNS